MMSFELERAFGRVLGLDYSQVNPGALPDRKPAARPAGPSCSPSAASAAPPAASASPTPPSCATTTSPPSTASTPSPPRTSPAFPASSSPPPTPSPSRAPSPSAPAAACRASTSSPVPLDANGNPLYQYTVTFVSGAYFTGNHGNPVTGLDRRQRHPLHPMGLDRLHAPGLLRPQRNPAASRRHLRQLPGHLRAHQSPLHPRPTPSAPTPSARSHPPARFRPSPCPTSPRAAANPQPSTSPTPPSAAIRTPSAPRPIPAPCPPAASGSAVSARSARPTGSAFPVRGNRTFTVVTQALDETGAPTDNKAMPVHRRLGRIRRRRRHRRRRSARPQRPRHRRNLAPGLTSGATTSSASASPTSAATAAPTTPTTAGSSTPTPSQPLRLPASGGPIVIHGMGFRLADTVLVGGQPALVTSISPNEITAIAPAAASGVTGSVDVEVDDLPAFYAAAILSGGISYDSGTGDALTLVTAPCRHRAHRHAHPLHRHRARPRSHPRRRRHRHLHRHQRNRHSRLRPAHLLRHRHRRRPRHHERHRRQRHAWSIVTASLTNGSSLQAQFTGGTPPVLASLTPAALARRRSHLHLDRPGSRRSPTASPPPANPSPGRPPRTGIAVSGLRSRPHQLQRHRHHHPHRRPARRGPNRHHQRLPQRNQPVRHLHRLWLPP